MQGLTPAIVDPLQAGRASASGMPALDDSLALVLDFMAGGLDSRLSVARGSTGTYFDANGVLQSAAQNVGRLDHTIGTGVRRGLLVEEQRTNYVRNNSMAGAGAGVLPTNWGKHELSGMTVTPIGVFTVNGIPVLRVRVSGTPVATGTTAIYFETGGTGVTGLAVSTAVTRSLYLAVSGGSLTNISQLRLWGPIKDSGNATVVDDQAPLSPSPTATLARYQDVVPTPDSGSAPFTMPNHALLLVMTSGQAVDVTLDIGAPQVEVGAPATSVILTSGSAATRGRDLVTMPVASWYADGGAGTIYCRMLVDDIVPSGGHWAWTLSEASETDRIGQYNQVGFSYTQLIVVTANTTVINGSTGNQQITPGTSLRYAVGWDAAGNWRDASAGALGTALTGKTVPTGIDALVIGNRYTGNQAFVGWIQRLRYWRRKLQDGELQAETR